MDRRDRVAALMHEIALRHRDKRRPIGLSDPKPKRARKVPGVDGRKRPLTLEHRAALSAAHALRNAQGGRPQSEATRARISVSQRLRHPKPAARCHPDRPHYGHGQCRQCYNRDYMRAKRASMRPQGGNK
jgi:hypothetical protein